MAQGVKRAGSRKTVSAVNLAALGVDRLAGILLDVAEDEPGLKRRLRMELAGEVGAEHLAAELNKRLSVIDARRSRVHWRKYKAFVRELELHRAMIVGPLAQLDPKLALEFLWRFLDLADGVFQQVNDERGDVEQVFSAAATSAGQVVDAAKPDPHALADRIARALEADEHGVLGDLVAAVLPVLDAAGIAVLRKRLQTAFESRPRPNAALGAALRLLADAVEDVEGYVATLSVDEKRQPWVGGEIARRLLAASRIEDALAALARSAPPPAGRTPLRGVHDWEGVFLDALEADGQAGLAQEMRWAAFERRLAVDRLRAFLRRLPEFDDVEVEDRALAYAATFANFTDALRFLIAWPALGLAAELVSSRTKAIDAGRLDVLEPAVAALEARYPLAASLLLRAMIADARANGGKMPERLAAELTSLSVQVADWGRFESHEDFIDRMARLRRV